MTITIETTESGNFVVIVQLDLENRETYYATTWEEAKIIEEWF